MDPPSSSSSSSTPSEVNYGDKLKLAADSGDFAEIKKLIEKDKVDINLSDAYGDTCLHAAVQKGRRDIVLYLLNHDANPNIRNKAGSTPLHKVIGTQVDQLEILRALLKNGADPNIKNTAGLLPEQMTTKPLLLEILQGSDAVEEKIVVPKALHGRVIGKKGVVLNEIRDLTSCSIQLPPPKDASNEITIRGRKENVEKAKQLILEVTKKEEGPDPNQEYTSVQLPIPKDKLKFIIGRGGKKIEELRDEFEVDITIPKEGDLDGMVLVKGASADNVDQATRKIFYIVQNPPKPKPARRGGSGGGSGSGSGSAGSKQNGKGPQKGGAGGGSKPRGDDGQRRGSQDSARGSGGGGGSEGKGKAKEKQ
eukprot:TRINITY_DN1209_c0_g1_i1.p1 TRINITY_DN1209_c0_g1~~TRINITY_DN1209_c0_g1_i1.p1  ORF type:complete len:365 (-),score=95.93 TRINITY_DN1209_c0_g1_i1:123-1217(-)